MRNVKSLWKKQIPKTNHQEFNFDDISIFLSEEGFFTINTFPFKDWKDSDLTRISATFLIKHTINDSIPIKDIIFVIDKINNRKVNAEDIRKLPFIVLHHLYNYYILSVAEWYEYFYNNIKDYCKTPASDVRWKELKYSQDYGAKSEAKAVWLIICDSLDREFWTKFAISLRESMLPWLNAEMYKNYKDRKDNTRTNIEYEKQRQLMAEGDLSGMDIPIPEDVTLKLKKGTPVSFNTSSFSDEDLDEIKIGN